MTEQQFAALFGVLCQIRDALMPAPDETGGVCVHPEESRVSLGFTNGQPHWVCRDCKYEHVAAST